MEEQKEYPERALDRGDEHEPADPEYEYASDEPTVKDGYYGTGSTTPPKDHAGLVALILILIVSCASIISGLRLMNIDIFDMPEETQESVPTVLIGGGDGVQTQGLEVSEPTEAPTDPTERVPGWSTRLEIRESPAGQPNVAAAEGAISWQEVYEKVIPSVVSIVCTDGQTTSSGTGVIMDTDGYLLTNAHVVEGSTSIQVILSDDRTFAARCMGSDRISDLAVLHIDAEGLVPAEFGDSSVLRVGDAVVAIGDPLGVELRGTMTDGIVSAINRDIRSHGRTMTLIQTTAALNAGNSGGPLVNCYGQVVGINTMKIGDYASDGGVEGLGFAIPVTTVQQVIDELITRGYVSGRPDLGLRGSMVSSFYQYYYRLPRGMLVEAVDPDSDAAAKGVHPGDILLTLDSVRITDPEMAEQIIFAKDVGDEVEASLYRDGREYRLKLQVGESKG